MSAERAGPWIMRRERVVAAVQRRVDPEMLIDDALIWAIDEFCKILIDKQNCKVIFNVQDGVVQDIEGIVKIRRPTKI